MSDKIKVELTRRQIEILIQWGAVFDSEYEFDDDHKKLNEILEESLK